MKYLELFERRITREPKIIGDFIFDIFFNGDNKLTPSIKEYEPGTKWYGKIDRDNYTIVIECQHVYNENLTVETLDKFKNILEQLETICIKGTKTNPGIIFKMNYGRIYWKLRISKEKIDEILQSPEHEKWLEDNKEKYNDFLIMKTAKKYNL